MKGKKMHDSAFKAKVALEAAKVGLTRLRLASNRERKLGSNEPIRPVGEGY